MKGSHNTQRNYERYLVLAQAEARAWIAAENYYLTPNTISDLCPRAHTGVLIVAETKSPYAAANATQSSMAA